MAAGYLRQLARDPELGHVIVDSAGTLGITGAPASPESIEVMQEIGVDLRGHRSRALSAALLRGADIVVAMTREHLDEMAACEPDGEGRRYLLRGFERGAVADPDAADLDDPIGRPVEFYRKQRELLLSCLDHLAIHLRQLR